MSEQKNLVVKYKPDNDGICHIETFYKVDFYFVRNALYVVPIKVEGVELSTYVINFDEVRSISYLRNKG